MFVRLRSHLSNILLFRIPLQNRVAVCEQNTSTQLALI